MVLGLAARYSFQTILELNLVDWTKLMPGYMHMRFDNNMVSDPRSEPKNDIVEPEAVYVYLKVFGADHGAIRRQMGSTGTPPLYIPMPPY